MAPCPCRRAKQARRQLSLSKLACDWNWALQTGTVPCVGLPGMRWDTSRGACLIELVCCCCILCNVACTWGSWFACGWHLDDHSAWHAGLESSEWTPAWEVDVFMEHDMLPGHPQIFTYAAIQNSFRTAAGSPNSQLACHMKCRALGLASVAAS